jgi:hypothetical protein
MARRRPGWAYRAVVGVLPPAGATVRPRLSSRPGARVTPIGMTPGGGLETPTDIGADHITGTTVGEAVR